MTCCQTCKCSKAAHPFGGVCKRCAYHGKACEGYK